MVSEQNCHNRRRKTRLEKEEKKTRKNKERGNILSRNPSISRGWTVFQPASATQKGHNLDVT